MSQFKECTSLSISYDNLGLATVNYTIVSDVSNPSIDTTINAGNQIFTGYVTALSINSIPGTNWYETQVSLITVTN